MRKHVVLSPNQKKKKAGCLVIAPIVTADAKRLTHIKLCCFLSAIVVRLASSNYLAYEYNR